MPALSSYAQAERIARGAGNAAFAAWAQRSGGSNALARQPAPPLVAADPHAEWRSKGNLVGNPPARAGVPPSTDVVEREDEYRAALARAEAILAGQRRRVAQFLDPSGRNVTDYRYFFAKVYSYVTEQEIDFVKAGAYYYPTYVLRCVEYFDRIYSDNLKAFEEKGPVEHHWKQAFRAAASAQERVAAIEAAVNSTPDILGLGELQVMGAKMMASGEALTEAMKAHIRFDLPRAEVWVFNSRYASFNDVKLSHFQSDFASMAGVFDNAGALMQVDMTEKLGIPLALIPRLVQDQTMRLLFDADMGSERADTWRRAIELQAKGGNTGPYKPGSGGGLDGDVTRAENLSGIEGLGGGVKPDMNASLKPGPDAEELLKLSATDLAKVPGIRRIQLLRMLVNSAMDNDILDLVEGNTLDWLTSSENPEAAIMLRVLRASLAAGDLVIVVDAADAWDIGKAIDGDPYDVMRDIFMRRYYGQTGLRTALGIIEKCLDGNTKEWEEEMVADLVVLRGDRGELVEALGALNQRRKAQDASMFHRGLDLLEVKLDGVDEERVHAAFGGEESGI